jgi:excisionase family DNA binding protein
MSDHLTTIEVARMLGMAVRSVQTMVDRGTLEAWKTPGGHRRITRRSVEQWLASRGQAPSVPAAVLYGALPRASRVPRILLIEAVPRRRQLVEEAVRHSLPSVDLHVADDGIAGIALAGRLEPDLLIVDLTLPGIDGVTLATSLCTHPQFRLSRVVVITGAVPVGRWREIPALASVPVVTEPRLRDELPPLLASLLPPDLPMPAAAAFVTPAPAGLVMRAGTGQLVTLVEQAHTRPDTDVSASAKPKVSPVPSPSKGGTDEPDYQRPSSRSHPRPA